MYYRRGNKRLDLGFKSKTYYTEVVKRVLDGYMPNIDDEVYDDIIKEIEDSTQQDVLDVTYSNSSEGDDVDE